MARYRLDRARWLRNGWLLIIYRTTGRMRRRMVRPGEPVAVAEAALALGTYRGLMYRLRDAGRLRVEKGTGSVPWRELIRLRREWRGKRATTVGA